MRKILFLGGPIYQIPIVQRAKVMGAYVGIVDINKEAPALPYADETFCASVKDVDAVYTIASAFKPDGIMIGACDTSVVTAAKICEKMNLPGLSVSSAVCATDKVEMLKAFEKYGVAHPAYQVVKKDEIDHFSMKVSYPAVSKPTDSAGGRGISIIHDERDLFQAVHFSSSAGYSGEVLIEEYMTGPEVSVEMLVVDGIPHVLQITDKITSGEPHFFEIGHSQPSIVAEATKEQIRSLASQAVLAVGLVNSPAHVEIKITPSGPKMVELGARLGGGCITTYLLDTSVSGINMAEAALMQTLGQKPDVSHCHDSGKCVGIRFIPAKEGTIASITGYETAMQCQGVLRIDLSCRIGQTFHAAVDDSARLGHVICEGSTTAEALSYCQAAIDKLTIQYI